ncbi:MAG: cytidylate kinase-like family protein [Lachnospiraceae bacterium]|nr:cytidylate kinase-like family protein [Lachnospiraceae bacterium]
MKNRRIIVTIGRQTGSGGRKIGRILAESLGIEFYDKELLDLAAKESGFAAEVIEKHDEKPTHSFLYSLVMDGYGLSFPAGFGELPLDHQVFLAEFNTIRKIVRESSCVIVGRCADYALEEDPDLLSVFIYAKEEDKIARIMQETGFSETKSRELIMKKDRMRSNYYNYFSSKKWGASNTYHLCLNSSVFGIEGTAEMIRKALEVRAAK